LSEDDYGLPHDSKSIHSAYLPLNYAQNAVMLEEPEGMPGRALLLWR
jgi:hypothetical protein